MRDWNNASARASSVILSRVTRARQRTRLDIGEFVLLALRFGEVLASLERALDEQLGIQAVCLLLWWWGGSKGSR